MWKEEGREVYGARKVWRELNRQGVVVARCTVKRLMHDPGVSGVVAGHSRLRTTRPDDAVERPADLLERRFGAPVPNRRWVAGITYVETSSGWVCTAFVMDLFARVIVGWKVADHLRSDLAPDTFDIAVRARRHEPGDGLIHHSDRGVSLYLDPLHSGMEEARVVHSVGSRGDSFDNAAAEALNSLYKRELIDFRGAGEGVSDVMVTAMDWVQWYSEVRLHSSCEDMPPQEYEEVFYKARQSGIVGDGSQA